MKKTLWLFVLVLLLCTATITQSGLIPYTPPSPTPVDSTLWFYNQLTVVYRDRTDKFESDCMGYLQVNADRTFYIWNTCREVLSTCYVVEEASGNWRPMVGKGIYKFEYGPYYYIAYFGSGVGTFASFSMHDYWDSSQIENGVLYKIEKVSDLWELTEWFGKKVKICP